MSRIGKQPVLVSPGVSVTINGSNVVVKGPKGELKRTFHPSIQLLQQDGKILVSLTSQDPKDHGLHGLFRMLLFNMVKGVSEGFKCNLQIVGVGYRAQMEGKKLSMQLGHSHPVVVEPPSGVTVAVAANTKVTVAGADKQAVGDFAAQLRSYRPPEVYKGKGIRYEGEYIRRKAGKAAAKKK